MKKPSKICSMIDYVWYRNGENWVWKNREDWSVLGFELTLSNKKPSSDKIWKNNG